MKKMEWNELIVDWNFINFFLLNFFFWWGHIHEKLSPTKITWFTIPRSSYSSVHIPGEFTWQLYIQSIQFHTIHTIFIWNCMELRNFHTISYKNCMNCMDCMERRNSIQFHTIFIWNCMELRNFHTISIQFSKNYSSSYRFYLKSKYTLQNVYFWF